MRGCAHNLLCSPKKIKKKYRNMLILKKILFLLHYSYYHYSHITTEL